MYLGLDIGTSGVKSVSVDDEQRILCKSSSDLEVSRPHDGWSEQNPDCWLAAVRDAISALRKEVGGLEAVRAIGLSGQMHGSVVLDAKDTPLRPAFLWNDTRSSAQAALLDRQPGMRQITGNIVFPGFTAPKLMWMAEEEPELFSQVRSVLLPKDYVRLWLTGEKVTDMSDASGTGWLAVGDRSWSELALGASGMAVEQMPRLVEGSEASGELREDLAVELGLSPGIPVAGGGGDNAASAIGAGVVRAGEAFLSLGTSGVLFAATDSYAPNAESAIHTFCHALPKTWHKMGVILACTDALNWFAEMMGRRAPELTAACGDNLQRPGRAMFLPYLGGERTPHNDSEIRAGFVGLSHSDDATAMTRALLEGTAFAFRDSKEALAASGTAIDKCYAIGGGSASDYWVKVLATALNLPLSIVASSEVGGAFGAARLAMLSDGALVSEVCAPPHVTTTIDPEPEMTAEFDAAYRRFRDAYPSLKDF